MQEVVGSNPALGRYFSLQMFRVKNTNSMDMFQHYRVTRFFIQEPVHSDLKLDCSYFQPSFEAEISTSFFNDIFKETLILLKMFHKSKSLNKLILFGRPAWHVSYISSWFFPVVYMIIENILVLFSRLFLNVSEVFEARIVIKMLLFWEIVVLMKLFFYKKRVIFR